MAYGPSTLPLLEGDRAEVGGGIIRPKLPGHMVTWSHVRMRLCQQAEVVAAVLLFPSRVSVHLSGGGGGGGGCVKPRPLPCATTGAVLAPTHARATPRL